MKTRHGFVSNSSSSSFVILGIKLNDHPKLDSTMKLKIAGSLKKEFPGEEEIDFSDDWIFYGDLESRDIKKLFPELPKNTTITSFGENGYCLGYVIGRESDYSLKFQNVNLKQLNDYAKEFKKATEIEPELFGGTYSC